MKLAFIVRRTVFAAVPVAAAACGVGTSGLAEFGSRDGGSAPAGDSEVNSSSGAEGSSSGSGAGGSSSSGGIGVGSSGLPTGSSGSTVPAGTGSSGGRDAGGGSGSIGGSSGSSGASSSGSGDSDGAMDARSDSGAPGGDDAATDAGNEAGALSFARDVYPTITARCIACHTPGGTGVIDGQLDFTTNLAAGAYRQLLMPAMGTVRGRAGTTCAASALTRVVPGTSVTSLLYNKVASKLAGMPALCGNAMPNPVAALPLTVQEVNTIRDWIDQGASP